MITADNLCFIPSCGTQYAKVLRGIDFEPVRIGRDILRSMQCGNAE